MYQRHELRVNQETVEYSQTVNPSDKLEEIRFGAGCRIDPQVACILIPRKESGSGIVKPLQQKLKPFPSR